MGNVPGVEVTHPDRVLFPDQDITKGDVVDYYRRVAPVMVPHLRNRPLMLERYRDAIDRGGFYQKEASEYFPASVRRVEVPKAGGVVHHPVVEDEDALVYLANQGCLTFHCWTAQADQLRRPDRVVFDLGPAPADGAFASAPAAALRPRPPAHLPGLWAPGA